MDSYSIIPDPSILIAELKQNPSHKKIFDNNPDIEEKIWIDENHARVMKWISIFLFFCPSGRNIQADFGGGNERYKDFFDDKSLKLKIMVATIANPEIKITLPENFLLSNLGKILSEAAEKQIVIDRSKDELFLFCENNIAIYKNGLTEITNDWDTIAYISLLDI